MNINAKPMQVVKATGAHESIPFTNGVAGDMYTKQTRPANNQELYCAAQPASIRSYYIGFPASQLISSDVKTCGSRAHFNI